MLFLQLSLLLWSLFIAFQICRTAPQDWHSGYWAHLFSLHCMIQVCSIGAMAGSHLMRLSVRFMQPTPYRFLFMMRFNDAALSVLVLLTLVCNIQLLGNRAIPGNLPLNEYISCSYLFILYHLMIGTLFSKTVHQFFKRLICGFVNGRIELHRSVGDFHEVEQTVQEIFDDICNASEIGMILDALKLTRAFQRYRKVRSARADDLENGISGCELDLHPVEELEFYSRAVKYAIGIYGVSGSFWQNPRLYFRYFLGGYQNLRRKGRKLYRRPSHEFLTFDSGFMQMCNVRQEEIVVEHFQPSLFLPAFVIFADHKNREAWIALSGSSTMEDVLTDLHAHPNPVNVHGFQPMYAHAGIWRTAVNLHKKLQQSQALRDFLVKHSDYELILTGHSLGAAAAAALMVLFKNEPLPTCEERQCRVIGFGCPPVFSYPLHLPCVTQIVIVDDCITQLNLRTIKCLMSEMSVLTNAMCSSAWNERMPRRWTCDYEAKVQRMLLEFFESQDIDAIEDEIDLHFRLISNKDKHIQLYLPGQRVPLRPVRDSIQEDDADRGITDGILITPTMLSSHMYLSHQAALEQAIRRAKSR